MKRRATSAARRLGIRFGVRRHHYIPLWSSGRQVLRGRICPAEFFDYLGVREPVGYVAAIDKERA